MNGWRLPFLSVLIAAGLWLFTAVTSPASAEPREHLNEMEKQIDVFHEKKAGNDLKPPSAYGSNQAGHGSSPRPETSMIDADKAVAFPVDI